MPEIGTSAPLFTLPDQDGVQRSIADWRGKKVVLYFYSRDMTGGCTKQALGFKELYPQFLEKGAVVVGVSPDTAASHRRFADKYELPFTLLADPEKQAIGAYGVWREKKNYGKTTMGVVRSTYLIGEDGTLLGAFENVKAAENPAKMLEKL